MGEPQESLSFKMGKQFHDNFTMIVGKLDDTDKSKVLRALAIKSRHEGFLYEQ